MSAISRLVIVCSFVALSAGALLSPTNTVQPQAAAQEQDVGVALALGVVSAFGQSEATPQEAVPATAALAMR